MSIKDALTLDRPYQYGWEDEVEYETILEPGINESVVRAISEIKNERVGKVTDVLEEGQEVKVKVLAVDDRGKVRLSMRVVDQETGEELEDTRPPREEGEGRGDRGPRGRGRDGGRDGGRGGDRGGDREGGRGGRNRRGRGRREEGGSDEGGASELPDFIAGGNDD